jgi:hypothetical protein
MVPQTQITEVKAELEYAVAHQAGPTYTGPSSGYGFVNGLLDELVPGRCLLQNGMPNITHFWEAKKNHQLKWKGDVINGEWMYVPMGAKPVEPASPAPAPRKPTRKAKKKAKGKK